MFLLGVVAASITLLGVGISDDSVTRSALALCDVPACRQVYLNARDSLKSIFEAQPADNATRAQSLAQFRRSVVASSSTGKRPSLATNC